MIILSAERQQCFCQVKKRVVVVNKTPSLKIAKHEESSPCHWFRGPSPFLRTTHFSEKSSRRDHGLSSWHKFRGRVPSIGACPLVCNIRATSSCDQVKKINQS